MFAFADNSLARTSPLYYNNKSLMAFTVEGVPHMFKSVTTLSKRYKNDIRKLVQASDSEFVPPLSARGSTTQKNLEESAATDAPTDYFNTLITQSFILCIKGFHVVGFLSYIPDHKLEAGDNVNMTCDYISTIIVDPRHRNHGITTAMYRKLFAHRPGKIYATRTWSLNHTHISLLNKLGFSLILTLKDDRGAGVDTVYYSKGH